jgi:lipopolysaccharide export system permease protein
VIILRYLSREIIVTLLAVSSILLLIVMSGRFARYLAEATTGRISVDILFSLIAFRMPEFLVLILPLGMFIAILLSYGRLYVESEMVVLSACGISQRQIVGLTLITALFVSAMVASLSLWFGPMGAQKTDVMLLEQRQRSEFDSLQEGRFQSLGRGQAITYVESLSSNRKVLNQVFVAQTANDGDNESLVVIVAEAGEQKLNPEFDQRYLMLQNGIRYEGHPGGADYSVMRFKTYGQHMPPADSSLLFSNKIDAKPTMQLFIDDDLESKVTLQWRFSLPLLVIIVAMLAVPLSKTNPRQGRYLKMLPALIIYLVYLGALIGTRGAMDSGKWPLLPGLWAVHGVFALLALLLLNWHNVQLWRQRRTSNKLRGAANA